MRRDAGARGGASAEDEEEEGGDDLLALHEAVGIIVDLEQELMDAHLKAIQVRRGRGEWRTLTPLTHRHPPSTEHNLFHRKMHPCSLKKESSSLPCNLLAAQAATMETTI
jgi:hypothetical protein